MLSSSNLAYQLSDITLTPILTSTSTSANRTPDHHHPAHLRNQAFTSLTSTAASAFDTASRLGLGVPQRIMIETQSHGPVVLHSFLNPRRGNESRMRSLSGSRRIVEQAREELRPLSGSTEEDDDNKDRAEGNSSTHVPPMLIATVVAPSATDAGEARRMAARLEKVGGDFQKEWVIEQSRGDEAEDTEAGEDEDG
ncbi:hypothetical protein B0J14DRAFT_468308 [Halenospora varia]|nr:hypothetical protein B0J14DRAFT_468308 [Halenospora varia]